MFTDQAVTTLPVRILLPILAVVFCALILAALYEFIRHNDGVWIVPLFMAVVVAGATAFGFYPYKAEYHEWRTATGTVAEVNKRLLSDGDGMKERYVLRLKDTGLTLACDDTRCSLLKPGDSVTLACKKEWEYASTDGWACRYRGE